MDVTPQAPSGRQLIQAYGDGGFKIANQRYTGPVLVLPDRTLDWPVEDAAALTVASLAPIAEAAAALDLLLLGCGRRLCPVPAPLRQAAREWGLGVEPMDTGAACRTFNVLLVEERRVAAALIPIP